MLTERPKADLVLDKPGRLVLPGLLNLHNHCFSESIARTHTEDGGGEGGLEHLIYEILLPLGTKGIALLSPDERRAAARLGILQLLKGGAATVMEPCRNSMPEMFEAAEEMGLRFYCAPYLFSTPRSAAGRAIRTVAGRPICRPGRRSTRDGRASPTAASAWR